MKTQRYSEMQKRALYEQIMTAISKEVRAELSRIDETENVDEGIRKNLAIGTMAALSMFGGPKAKADNAPSDNGDAVRIEASATDDYGKATANEIVNLTPVKGESTRILGLLNAIYQEYNVQKHGSYLGWGKPGTQNSRQILQVQDYIQGQFKGGDQIVEYNIGDRVYQILMPKDIELNADDVNSAENIANLKTYLKGIKNNKINSYMRAGHEYDKTVNLSDYMGESRRPRFRK